VVGVLELRDYKHAVTLVRVYPVILNSIWSPCTQHTALATRFRGGAFKTCLYSYVWSLWTTMDCETQDALQRIRNQKEGVQAERWQTPRRSARTSSIRSECVLNFRERGLVSLSLSVSEIVSFESTSEVLKTELQKYIDKVFEICQR
jgi:hypothetical protein